MNSIGPIKDWTSRLLFVTPGSSWGDVIERLKADVDTGIGSQNLVEFAQAVARLAISNWLYPSSCMFNLVISDNPDFKSANGAVHVAYRADLESFVIHHIGFDDRQEFITCAVFEALPTFERFVRECFRLGGAVSRAGP